ncbi:MAG: ABC transporter permease [Candidatus Borkfalkiaceae bacterium]|nr:ABC transporter permease [Christensenellaceae bacterium]
MDQFIAFLASAISIGTVFLYGCVGEITTEKSGHLNLGIPGIMCMGCAGGCYAVYLYMAGLADPTAASWFLLVLFSILGVAVFAGIGGLIYAFLTVSLKSNQNVTGLALTIFGTGFCQFFMAQYVDTSNFSVASKIIRTGFSFAGNLGWFGELFFSHGFFVYFAVIIAVVTSIVFRKTRIGLNLRAVGENPSTADAAGINVNRYKYVAILAGSAIAGLGGFFYVMDYIGGMWRNSSPIEGLGWISIALVIFTLWKPDLAILGAIIFGAFYIAPAKITGVSFTEMTAFKLLPYVVTIIVLIVTSVIGSKENQGPAALGASYFREER